MDACLLREREDSRRDSPGDLNEEVQGAVRITAALCSQSHPVFSDEPTKGLEHYEKKYLRAR